MKQSSKNINKIEIIGRLKESVTVNKKNFICHDVNLDSNFIIELSYDLIQQLGCIREYEKLEYEKFYDGEKVSKVKLNKISYDEETYTIVITRNTFDDKILIGCEVLAEEANIALFKSAYKLKLKLIDMYKRICKNSDIVLIEDYNNELICQSAYIKIYRIENKFRSILTRYLMKKYGELVLSKELKKNVDDYSNWFKKENSNKYKTFKCINTDYCNLDFSNLPKILDLKDSNIINEEGNSVSVEVAKLRSLLSDEADINDILKQVSEVERCIGKRKNIFDDKSSEKEHIFIEEEFIEKKYLKDILDDNFRKSWEKELSKMRNMVAHNKPICNELYDDIINTCMTIDQKFNECIDFIENNFYSDEEGVLWELEEMDYIESEYETDYVQMQREEAGIGMSLSEGVIETMITENLKTIQKFMDIIYKLENIRNIMEDIEYVNEEISSIDEDEDNEELRKQVFNIIKSELNLDKEFRSFREKPTSEIIRILLYNEIDIEEAIRFYTDEEKYPMRTSKFECFTMDYEVEWYGLNNKEYKVNFDGELSPGNGCTDELEFKLYIDRELDKKYSIIIDYGDYTINSDSNINDEQVNCMINDIKDNINSTVEFFNKIHKILMALSDLIQIF